MGINRNVHRRTLKKDKKYIQRLTLKICFCYSPHFPISPTFSPPTGEEEGEEAEKRRKVEEEEEEEERERNRREEKREIEEELAQTLEKARPHPPAPTSR